MFDEVAPRYDLTNAVLSLGNSGLWRIATTRAIAPRPGEHILDVAAGTGTSSAAIAKSGANVVAADFSPGMIAEGRRRHARTPRLTFHEADATRLPFDDNQFDAVTISFGLRNVVDVEAALSEFLRVTRPGGRLVICEFSTPPHRAWNAIYGFYQKRVMPLMARLFSSHSSAYDYLNESIRAWPQQAELAQRIRDAGYADVAWRNLTGGIVALHRAFKLPTGSADRLDS